MKFRYLFLIACLIGISVLLKAQSSYHTLLDTLYKNTVKTIQVSDLNIHDTNLIILDTRSESEFGVSHLPGAIWVDYDHFTEKDLNKFPKNKTIVTYCTVGYRSERVGEKLLELGYKDVFNLYGGIIEWVNEGNSVENMDQQKTERCIPTARPGRFG